MFRVNDKLVKCGDKVWNPTRGWGVVTGFDARYSRRGDLIEVNFPYPVKGFANRVTFVNNSNNLFWDEQKK